MHSNSNLFLEVQNRCEQGRKFEVNPDLSEGHTIRLLDLGTGKNSGYQNGTKNFLHKILHPDAEIPALNVADFGHRVMRLVGLLLLHLSSAKKDATIHLKRTQI